MALQKKYLSEKRLGFNCTGTRHRAAECRTVSGCQKCNGRQPTSICDRDSQQMLLAAGEGAVIYFVMVVDVDGIKCRALLDTDASAALIKKLGKQPSRMEHKRIDMMTCSTNQKVYKYDVKISSVVGDFNMAASVSKVDFGVHHLGTCLSKCWVWTMLAQYYRHSKKRDGKAYLVSDLSYPSGAVKSPNHCRIHKGLQEVHSQKREATKSLLGQWKEFCGRLQTVVKHHER